MLLSSSRTFSQAQEITETELFRPPPSNAALLLLTKCHVCQLSAFLHKGVAAALKEPFFFSMCEICKYS